MIANIGLKESAIHNGFPKKVSASKSAVDLFSAESSPLSDTAEDDILSAEEPSSDDYTYTIEVVIAGRRGFIYAGKDILASHAGVGGSVTAKYHEDSTDEDPIATMWGMDSKGNEYEEIIHLNEVDVQNATPAEMIALRAHLLKSGQVDATSFSPGTAGLLAWEGRDVNAPMDFEQFYSRQIAMKSRGDKIGAALLQFELERLLFFERQNER